MKSSNVKISSLIVMLFLLSLLTYLSLSLDKKIEYQFSVFELNGNRYLSKEQYINFAKLDNTELNKNLTLTVIKDRLEKHPYINYVDVGYEGNGKVNILIKEKEFKAILIENEKNFLLTEELELTPIIPSTSGIDYPIISNPKKKNEFEFGNRLSKNDDVITAFKILTTFELINSSLYENISDIDLRNGGDILIYFNFFEYPVIIGRGDEIKKSIYFNKLWNMFEGMTINNIINYVDLRYDDYVFLGLPKINPEEGDNRS